MTDVRPPEHPQAINPYGDVLVHAGGSGFGGEISHQREDELDRAALDRARELVSTQRRAPRDLVAYDIGAGHGTMAMKLADLGCMVIACDIEPMPALRAFAVASGSVALKHIIERDSREVDWSTLPHPDILYSQRFLHYLRFNEAVDLVRSMLSAVNACDVYLSMSGLRSELGSGYPQAELSERFGYLAKEMRGKHGIAHEVCLYETADAEKLAGLCGLDVVRLWSSDFGNVKMIAKKS